MVTDENKRIKQFYKIFTQNHFLGKYEKRTLKITHTEVFDVKLKFAPGSLKWTAYMKVFLQMETVNIIIKEKKCMNKNLYGF